jgi:hypothetical protein
VTRQSVGGASIPCSAFVQCTVGGAEAWAVVQLGRRLTGEELDAVLARYT